MKAHHRILLQNFSALFSVEMANRLLPLLALPYLVRVLGIDSFGAYVFSQAFVQFFIIFVMFGFDLYATRLISVHRQDKQYIQSVVNSIFVIRLLLTLVCFMALAAGVWFFDTLRAYWALHFINFLMVVGSVFFASYYYQGIEAMRIVALLNLLAKVFFTVLIFFFVKTEADLLSLAWLNAGGYWLAGLISLWIIYGRHGYRFSLPAFSELKEHMVGSTPFLWSRLAVTLSAASSTVMIGLILGNAATGVFGAAEKIFRAIVSFYGIFNQVLYPYIAYRKDIALYRKLFLVLVGLNAVVVLALIAACPWLMPLLFGEGMGESVILMQGLGISLIYILPAILLGYPLLGALGYTKHANNSVVFSCVFHLVGLVCLIPFFSLPAVIGLILLTEAIVLCYRMYFVRKLQLLKLA